MAFDVAGQVVDFGVAEGELVRFINAGKPFCIFDYPGKDDAEISVCNRPYGGSNPANILSYLFKLNLEDIEIVKFQMKGKRQNNFGNKPICCKKATSQRLVNGLIQLIKLFIRKS